MSTTGTAQTSESSRVRAVVIVPVLKRDQRAAQHAEASDRLRLQRSPEARMEEALGLARAINLDPVAPQIVMVAQPRPATLIGTGKIAEIAEAVKDNDAGLVIFDHPLTPVQQRNLEKALDIKVIDRTGLILEIFGERARTKEGVLQVDLAHLEYQRGRLVRSWTHLERQRGGGGFMGGPGETQIETDRRLLQEKIIKLKRELEGVRRTRDLHRAKRKKAPYPVVAIVGYTNAGKSTLFNRLTGAEVLAEDMLFATLDPTLRRIRLPHGSMAILSDTVGFISDLPTHLVAAFRATLEEVIEAELIIHLRDISDPDSAAQAEDVEGILHDLGIEAKDRSHVIEVWNKVDLLGEERPDLPLGEDGPVAVSAVTGEGLGKLLDLIEARLSGGLRRLTITLAPAHLHLIDWIYRNASIEKREDGEDGSVTLDLRVTEAASGEILARLKKG